MLGIQRKRQTCDLGLDEGVGRWEEADLQPLDEGPLVCEDQGRDRVVMLIDYNMGHVKFSNEQ